MRAKSAFLLGWQRRWRIGWQLCRSGGLAALLLAVSAQAAEVVDERGVKVTLAQAPQRIVSLLPSLTETVCALGQCQRLVGVDRYSNYPESVRKLKQVGGGLDPRLGERLESLGIKVLALEPKTHADVKRVLEQIALILMAGDAGIVWSSIDSEMQAAARSLPLRLQRSRVYFEVNRAPFAAGEGDRFRSLTPSLWCGPIRT